jgi:hypothetical protein
MDLLRSCYRSRMRLYSDSDATVDGQWHWCQPGAKPVPFPHSFASRNWDQTHQFPYEEPVGEVRRGRWRKGDSDPRVNGQRVCGSAQVWAEGNLTGDPVVDDQCCRPTEGWTWGGVQFGGRAKETYQVQDVSLGGLRLGAVAALEAESETERGQGGIRVGGLSTAEAVSASETYRGGYSLGGQAAEAASAVEPAGGGIALGGLPGEAGQVHETGQGGLRAGGLALAEAAQVRETGTGGLRAGGLAAAEAAQVRETGQGGVRQGGQGVEAATVSEVGQGGMRAGGEGIEAGQVRETGQGGVRQGGLTAEGATTSETGQGGMRAGGDGIEAAQVRETGQGGLAVGGDGAAEALTVALTLFTCAAVTPAGSTQGTALLLSNDNNKLSGGTNGQGVILPSGCYRIAVYNAETVVSGINYKVYPPSGEFIGTGLVNIPLTITGTTGYLLVRMTNGVWKFINMA